MRNHRRHAAALAALFFLSSGFTTGLGARSKTAKGNQAYDKGSYDEAMKHYTDAQVDAPAAPQLQYNIGDVLYQKKQYDQAQQQFQQSLESKDPTLMERSVYNLGNSLVQAGKLKEAVESYKKALHLDANDQDAKHNLEVVLQMLKVQQQQQQQKKDQKDDKKDQDRQQQQQQQQQEQQQQDQNKKDQQQPRQTEPQESPPRDEQQPQQVPAQMTKEQAEQLLEALERSEREDLNEKLRKETPTQDRNPAIDW